MGPRAVQPSKDFGIRIRDRRELLNLTIEQAAAAAGIGSETWRRYEGGGAIRQDKVRGLCKALRIMDLADLLPAGETDSTEADDPSAYWNSIPVEALHEGVVEECGVDAAKAIHIGLEILGDEIDMAITDLRDKPRGTHLGQVVTMLEASLPDRWLHRYDYEFCWRLRSALKDLEWRFKRPGYDGNRHLNRAPVDDLLIHAAVHSGVWPLIEKPSSAITDAEADEWSALLTNDDDLETYHLMVSDSFHPAPDDGLHFDNWFTWQFWGLDEGDQAKAGKPAELD